MKRLCNNYLKRLTGFSFFDINNRLKAIMYIDGKIFEGNKHSDCINKYLESKNIDVNYNSSQKPTDKQMDEYIKDVSYGFITLAKTINNNIALFLETDTINNTSKEIIIKCLNKHYPKYNVYLFNSKI
jgi:hypothetical protein